MAYPTGSGSERLLRGTVNALTNQTTALLFNGANNTTKNQETNVVPALHIITMMSMTFCNIDSSSALLKMYIVCPSPTDAIFLVSKQPIGIDGTFVFSDKFTLQGGDKCVVYLNGAGNTDVYYSYIDQDWS